MPWPMVWEAPAANRRASGAVPVDFLGCRQPLHTASWGLPWSGPSCVMMRVGMWTVSGKRRCLWLCVRSCVDGDRWVLSWY